MIVTTGGAQGCDTLWAWAASENNLNVHIFTFQKHKIIRSEQPNTNVIYHCIDERDVDEALPYVNAVVPNSESRNRYILNLWCRDYHIIKHAQMVLAVGYFDPESSLSLGIKGGTGITSEMYLNRHQKPETIFFYDIVTKQWYQAYEDKSWKGLDTISPIVEQLKQCEVCAVIGTREVPNQEEIKRVMNDLFISMKVI
jgi:hypothetical protein